MSKFTTNYEYEDGEGRPLELTVNFVLTPGDPGRYSGPPEYCYTATYPEIEIESVTVQEVDISPTFSEDFIETLEEQCWGYLEDLRTTGLDQED